MGRGYYDIATSDFEPYQAKIGGGEEWRVGWGQSNLGEINIIKTVHVL